MRQTRVPALPILWILAILPLAAGVDEYRKPDKDWGKGPVRWLMSAEEEKQFKALKTDEERAVFVKEFWAKRDPSPGTPINEFELVFWKKVEEADKGFKTPKSGAGSLTDKGRVFILLGPPTKTDKDARDRDTWTFEPNELTGIKEPVALTFAPGTTAPLLLDRKVLEKYVADHQELRGIGWKLPAPPAEELAQAPAAPARDAAEDLSPESRRQIPLLAELLSKGAGSGAVPVHATFDYYAAADGTTLTAITLEIPRDAAHGGGDTALFPFARLVPAGGGQPVNVTGDLAFVPAADAPAASYIYQARRNLAPGAYKVGLIVEDRVMRGQTGSLVQTIEVPDFARKEFSLSSIAFLAKFTQMQAGLGPDERPSAGPYILGSFRLVPRAVPTLLKNETVAFYFQVYNPAPDPASGRWNLEMTYVFHVKDGSGAWKRFGKPVVQAKQGQAGLDAELYAVDAKDLIYPNQPMPADYRLEIAVADKVSGKSIRRELAFSIN